MIEERYAHKQVLDLFAQLWAREVDERFRTRWYYLFEKRGFAKALRRGKKKKYDSIIPELYSHARAGNYER